MSEIDKLKKDIKKRQEEGKELGEALRRIQQQALSQSAAVQGLVSSFSRLKPLLSTAVLPGITGLLNETLKILRSNRTSAETLLQNQKETVERLEKLVVEIAKLGPKLQQPTSLTILSPRAGDSVRQGDTLRICWQSTGAIGDKLRIELLKNKTFFCVIDLAMPNNGTFDWRTPAALAPANNYQVRLLDPLTSREVISEMFEIRAKPKLKPKPKKP